ncbi:alpha-hydroxy-acid oxidizing protein [Intrasporangium sp.]|uniref:alpha-hydroxy-acid oxidizing protein n=1 Tax=Intrasporangium sp. TaxID=1925024 RepID=UPI00293B3F47|nr:alpha-hydroxy-acid oxidizing protein [Intrasporangium sp.]MDV3220376.1 alpha-hydroxy-acid oxidizing protein [Intrasporangium sp.]
MSEQESIGRRVQSRIYREGLFGRRPVVPVEPQLLERAARKKLSRRAWAYLAGSAGQQRTDAENRAAFDDHPIVPRVLVDVSSRELGVQLLGRRLPAPLLLAPIGALELAHPRSDVELAEGVRELGLPMVISTQGSRPMEETAATLRDCPRWFQLYWSSDDELVESLIRRAEDIGSDALVVTLDTHTLGWRTKDLDLGSLPFTRAEGIAQYVSDPVFRRLVEQRVAHPGPTTEPTPRPNRSAVAAAVSMARHWPGSLKDNLTSPLPRAAVETFLDVFSRPSLTWDHLPWLRERTRMPILLKGVQHPADAARAVEHGMDGIVVSNHGGRQVDGAIASIRALPAVVREVGRRVPVLFDSGVRSGADVYKALALGADAVMIGRPWVYGLAVGGGAGARAVLEYLLAELDLTMALTGARTIPDIRELGLGQVES